jgi:GTP-binding protein Era
MIEEGGHDGMARDSGTRDPGGPANEGSGARPDPGHFRAGFVAIVGRPNVGKSTLLNAFLKEKVAIVSDKPQTTRNTIRGILTDRDHQIVFLDTPGIHKPRDEINRYMVNRALATFHEVDLILFMVEPEPRPGRGDQFIAEVLGGVRTPVFLLINKMDRLQGQDRKAIIDACGRAFPWRDVFPLAALTGEGVKAILGKVVERMPDGHPFYPADQYTDQPLRFLSAEMIREKAFQFTGEEVPYAVAVEIESFREEGSEGSGLVTIEANIHVERPSQKGILIGKEGRMLKKIGSAARQDLEALLGTKVFLRLWVKVSKGWRNDPKSLRRFGYK